jgi:hypothetical protein
VRCADSGTNAHSSAIVSVACDACNQCVLSLSQDGCLHAWSFRHCRHQKTLHVDCGAVKMRLHPHTRLAALCCCDHSVRVADGQQMTLVRFHQQQTSSAAHLTPFVSGCCRSSSTRMWWWDCLSFPFQYPTLNRVLLYMFMQRMGNSVAPST